MKEKRRNYLIVKCANLIVLDALKSIFISKVVRLKHGIALTVEDFFDIDLVALFTQMQIELDETLQVLVVPNAYKSDCEELFEAWDKLTLKPAIMTVRVALKYFPEQLRSLAITHYPDQDITAVIKALFQTNLNVTQAAKRLNMHRNTLIYKINRFKKTTTLDVQSFYDAAALLEII